MPTLTATNVVVGVAMAMLAVGFASAFGRTHGVAWVAPVIGAWTIVAPWLVSGHVNTTRTIVNNVLVGALYLLLGHGAMAVGMRQSRQ